MKLFNTEKGVYLDQEKEPAFSRDIISFTSNIYQAEHISDFQTKEAYTLDDIIEIAKQAQIIDPYDGKLLHKKLKKAKQKKISYLIGDAVDDEPYISNQMAPLVQCSSEAVGGLKSLATCFSEAESYFTVYKHIFDLETTIPKEIDGFQVKMIGKKYPVKVIRAEDNNKSGLIIGVVALIYLHRALTQGLIQNNTMITVAGNCIGNPSNLEVSVGTPLINVIERCGLIKNPNRIVIGGAMAGINVVDPQNTLVTKHTGSILCFKDEEQDRKFACITCGKCERHCSIELNPRMIFNEIKRENQAQAIALGALECIGCGVCSYVCPSKINVSIALKEFKQSINIGGQDDDDDA